MENQQSEQVNPDRFSPEKLPFKIQEELIRRAISAWVEANAEKFRELIKADPDLLKQYLTDSKTALDNIEKKLKEKTIH